MLEKKIIRYIYVFSILLSAGTIIFFPKWLVDDAYITFRYAENLADHFQLTFNINAQPVEGYTGIILPVILAIAIKIGISPIIVTHSIGIISFFASGIFLVLLLKKIKISDIVCSITVLIYSFMPAVFTHIFSGLETILFLSMINAVIYFSIVLISNTPIKTSSLILFGLLLLLLSLARPEGVLFSSLIVLFCGVYFYIENTNLASKYFVSTTAVFIIPFSIYFIWRWNYYGQFFPNTYYLKTGNFNLEYKSFNSFIEFFSKYFSLPFLVSSFLILINIDQVWKKLKKSDSEILSKEFLYILLPTVVFTLILLIQYFHTDLLMNYSHRFFIPTLPILLIVLAIFFHFGFYNLQNTSLISPLTHKAYIILIICLFCFHFQSLILDMKREVDISARMKLLLDEVHIPTGKFIQENFNENSILLVHADAGAIPYFAKLKTIDFGGLNDDYLAHRNKLSDKEIIDYFFNVNADVLAITSFSKNKLVRKDNSLNWDTLKNILKDKRFKNYTLLKIFSCSVWNYHEFVFVKNEVYKEYHKNKVR